MTIEKLSLDNAMLWFDIPLQNVVAALSTECNCDPRSYDDDDDNDYDDDFNDDDFWLDRTNKRFKSMKWDVDTWMFCEYGYLCCLCL